MKQIKYKYTFVSLKVSLKLVGHDAERKTQTLQINEGKKKKANKACQKSVDVRLKYIHPVIMLFPQNTPSHHTHADPICNGV